MVIKISNAPQLDSGAHDQAAAEIETEIAKVTTDSKNPAADTFDVSKFSEPLAALATSITPLDRIEVGMSFKMPIAQFTMLEFSVKRSVPFNAVETDGDAVFENIRQWVSDKLNALIAEQQAGGA